MYIYRIIFLQNLNPTPAKKGGLISKGAPEFSNFRNPSTFKPVKVQPLFSNGEGVRAMS